jgi:hypothetical protein
LPANYDTWKSTNPDDERLGRSDGRPEAYRCRDCAWHGRGIQAASQHFWATGAGHILLPATDPRFDDSRTERHSA